MTHQKNIDFEIILLQSSLIDHLCDNFPQHDIGYAIKRLSQKLWFDAYKNNQNYFECLTICDSAIDIMSRYTDGYDKTITYHANDIVKCFKRIKNHLSSLEQNT